MAQGEDLDRCPGFRRRFRITPSAGRVTAAVEDDYHCMLVSLRHSGTVIEAVESVMDRVPWTTCPGAPAVLSATFAGVPLAEAARRGDKPANCTHLHDLATLAAAHAHDRAPFDYDILVADPVEAVWTAAIRRGGAVLLHLSHRDDILLAPEGAAGLSLFRLRDWIGSLPADLREPARLLQWGAILAHGRVLPMDRQSDATRIPPNCYTFQEARRHVAQRVGMVLDFSAGPLRPLDHLATEGFRPRPA